jgi:hypothetical protein
LCETIIGATSCEWSEYALKEESTNIFKRVNVTGPFISNCYLIKDGRLPDMIIGNLFE